jgi:hypothetical protein
MDHGMKDSLKWLVTASIVNLLGNAIGAIVALQENLAAGLGSVPNAQTVLQDFIAFKGTALSAPLSFMLIQLVLTWLTLRPDGSGRIGVGGLTFIGFFYALAQLGEPIFFKQFQPSGFDLAQSMVLLVNIVSSVAMLVFGIKVWRKMQLA